VSSEDPPSKIDTSVAHPARRYDYWLGGNDNFAADRESGDAVEAQFPTIWLGVRENRWFLCRAVHFAARQEGIRQFSHATLEHLPPGRAEALIKADGRAHPRSGAQLAALFARPDLELVEPVKSVSQWWPEAAPEPRPAAEDVACNGLVARVVHAPEPAAG
jgi:hypothetical protein